jgi:hypothetical protein
MAIQAEIWVQDFVENLFPNDQFSAYAVNHDAQVVEGAVVHVPGAGSVPTVVKNRTTYPATVGARTDTDLTYTLAEFSTDPVHLRNAERFELSYDKRMSLIGEHIAVLRQSIHDDLLLAWVGTATGLGALPAAQVLQTTGTLVGGKRQPLLADLIRIKREMDRANVPDDGRYLLMSPDLYNDLFNITDLLNAENMGRETLPNGVVAQVLGFNVLKRSYTPIYDAALAVRPKGAAPAGTDRQSAIAWSRYSVSRALGEVSFFERVDDPTYYGDIYSAAVRAGGMRLRNSGVFALVQANS